MRDSVQALIHSWDVRDVLDPTVDITHLTRKVMACRVRATGDVWDMWRRGLRAQEWGEGSEAKWARSGPEWSRVVLSGQRVVLSGLSK